MSNLCSVFPQIHNEVEFQTKLDIATRTEDAELVKHPIWASVETLSDEFLESDNFQNILKELGYKPAKDVSLKRILALLLLSEYESRNPNIIVNKRKGRLIQATSTRLWGSNFDVFNTIVGCITDAKEVADDTLVEFYTSIANEIATQTGRDLDLRTLFNPATRITNQFAASDHLEVAKIMTKCYFDHINDDLSTLDPDNEDSIFRNFNEGTTLGSLTSYIAVKEVMLELLREDINIAKTKALNTRYNDINVEYLFENLNRDNSSIYKYFVDYIKEEGINLLKRQKVKSSEKTEESTLNGDKVENNWDNTEYLDRKSSLSDIAKRFLSKTIGRSTRTSSRGKKFYLDTPMDVRGMWPYLVNVFKDCKTRQEFYTKVTNLAQTFTELQPLADEFIKAFEEGNEESIQLVNSVIAGVGMGVTPVDVLSIGDKGVELLTRNKEAFPQRVVADQITSNIKSILRNKSVEVKYDAKTKAFTIDSLERNPSKAYKDTEHAIESQIKLLNALGIDVDENALTYYYAQFGKNALQDAYASIDGYISKIVQDIESNYKKPADERTVDVHGYIYDLASILTTSLYVPVSMTYTDVENNLGYTPQYDSHLTKFTRNWIQNGIVNEQAIKDSFKYLLEDPIINNPTSSFNLLMYNEQTGLGIFIKNSDGSYSVAPSFKKDVQSGKQFNIAAFNGLLLGDKGLKYRVINGSLYSFTEIALALPNTKDQTNYGRYTFLTSDSPRSYTMSMKQIEIDDLFDTEHRDKDTLLTNCRINRDATIFKYLTDIVKSDLQKFELYGAEIFNLPEDANIHKYHNVKYWNGKFEDGKPQLLEDGIPTGRAFQFLNITYNKNGKKYNLIEYIAEREGVTVADVYDNLIKYVRNEEYNELLIPDNTIIEEFVENYIRWCATEEIGKLDAIADPIYKKILLQRGVRKYNQEEYDAKFKERLEEWAAQRATETNTTKEEFLVSESRASERDNATKKIKIELSHSYTVETSDGYRLNMLKVFLNKAVQTKFINDVFEGSQDEYTNTVDYNKRISQVTKIGMNLIELDKEIENRRKVLVIEDFKFGSNIVDALFGEGAGKIQNETIKRLHDKVEKINDSQSFITDKTLIKFLKATGRWNKGTALRTYVEDLMNPTKEFNPVTYAKVIEQLKCFGTCRRTRNSFLNIYNENDPFGKEVDTVQIKDSTVVLFKNAIKGSALEQMYDFMINNKIDQISPISAVKVSGITPVAIHDKNTGAFIGKPEGVDLANHTLNMLNSDFVIQQDMPSEILDDDAVLGSQLIKQFVEGLDWTNAIYDLDGKKVTGEEIFNEFQKVLSANITEDTLEFVYSLAAFNEDGTLTTDRNGHIRFDIKKVLDLCKDMIEDDTDALNVRQMLELGEDGNSKISLSHPLIAPKLERLLAAKISRTIGGKHLNGFAAPIRPDIFTVDNGLIDHNNDITQPNKLYARSTDDEATAKAKKEAYDKMMDDYISKSSITFSSDFIERCKREGRPLTLQAEHRTEDGKEFIYAEVITSAWKKEFYDTIATTKEVETGGINEKGNPITKTIYTIDLDKLSPEARRMVGIRIPTEGKQSMVVFEVVGILNTGATQVIFPQTLVNRTGWDFDIDKIFAYWRAVKFNAKGEQYKYSVVEFKSSESQEIDQKSTNFASKVFKEQTDRIRSKNILNSMEINDEDGANLYDAIAQSFHPDNPNSTVKQLVTYIDSLLDNDKLSKFASGKLKSLKKKIKALERIAGTIDDRYNDARDVYNLLIDENDSTEFEESRYLSDYGTSTLKRLFNSTKMLIDQIAAVQNAIEEFDNLAETSKSINIVTNNRTYKDIKSLCSGLYESAIEFEGNTNLKEYVDSLSLKIQTETDNVVNGLKKAINYEDDIYKQNSREARDNRILDLITSVLSNQNHAVEVNKPNIMDDIIDVSKVVNKLYGFNLESFNPLNFNDSIGLNNMSMGSTVLKGHSVNFDTLIATLSTMNAQLATPVKKAIHVSQVPLPDGFESYDDVYSKAKNGNYYLKPKYREYIANIVGSHQGKKGMVINFTFNAETGTIVFQDRFINNDANNTHKDISGGRIEYQANQVTSAVLDILKSSLGSAVSIHTLSLFRTLCLGTSTEMYEVEKKDPNDKTKIIRVNQLNRFAYPMMFIHQPCIMEMLDYINSNLITDPYINFDKASKEIKTKYYKDLVDFYLEGVTNGDIVPIDSHQYIVDHKEEFSHFGLDLWDKIATAIDENFTSFKGESIYQTTQELENNIKNRNDENRGKHLINQVKVLRALDTYVGITDELVNINFVIKTNADVQTFYHADNKQRQLSDCYYPTAKIAESLKDSYQASLPELDNEYAADFFTTTDIKAFNEKYGYTTRKTSYGEESIPRIPYKLYLEAISKVNSLSTVAEKEAFIKRYGLSVKSASSIIVDKEGNRIVDKIFTKSNTSLINQLTSKIDSASIYQTIEATFEYTHRLMAESFEEVFIHRIPEVRDYIVNALASNKDFISQKDYNDVVKNFLAYVSTVKLGSGTDVQNVFDPSDRELAQQILGINYESNPDMIKKLTKANLGHIMDKDFFRAYTKLSLKDQLDVLKHNKTLKNYITRNPEFNNVNILDALEYFERRTRKPYDEFRLVINDDKEHLHNLYMNSIAIMWKSNVPFVAHTIRQLIAHQALTNGLTYGYNVSKYVPVEIFSEPIENEIYDYYMKEAGAVDITRNIHNVNSILVQNHNLLRALSEDGTINDVLENIMPSICKMTPATHGKMPHARTRKAIWDSGESKATFGQVGEDNFYAIEIPTKNAEKNSKSAFYETEWRLINGGYINYSHLTIKNSNNETIVYEKRLIKNSNDPRYKVYAYVPVEMNLPGEHSIASGTDSLVNDYALQDEFKVGKETLDLDQYLLLGVDEFLKKVASRNTFGQVQVEAINTGKPMITDGDTGAGTPSENIDEQDQDDGSTPVDPTLQDEDIPAPFNIMIYDMPIDSKVDRVGSLSDAIHDVINHTDNSIYITRSGRATHTPTGSGQIAQNLHLQQQVITVDYTKSPADEALRIAKKLKAGKLYLNGDTKDLVDMSTNDMYHWTQAFVNNLELIAPKIETIYTILNSGFGQMVAKVHSKTQKESINIYENPKVLFNELVVNDPTVDALNNAFVINGNIANTIMSNIKKVHRFIEKISSEVTAQFNAVMKEYRSKTAELDIDIQEALEMADREAIEIAYEHIVKLSQIIYQLCLNQYNVLNSVDYAKIHNNYGQKIDYKQNLTDLIKLISYFDKYLGLQLIDIKDTNHRDATEADLEAFKNEFGTLNSHLAVIKRITADAQSLKTKAHNMSKRVLAWKIIDESRNPKFTTAFSKVLEYLEEHDYTLDGFDSTSLEISADEFLKIQSILFAFDKDISWWMSKLDSAFVTGDSLIDIVGKSWDEANLRAKRYVSQVVSDLNSALEEFETDLSKNAKKRTEITRKFINEEGDFIETYDTKGLYGSLNVLKTSIDDLIEEDFDTQSAVRTVSMNDALDKKITDAISAYNEEHKWDLVELTREEQEQLTARFRNMGERERAAYMRREHLVELPRMFTGGQTEIVYYKVDFSKTPQSEAFKSLTDKEKVLLEKIKGIIQEVIYNYNPEWIMYDSEADLFVPYIPQATLAEALRGYASISKIHHDEYYIDIDGTKQTVLKSHTLRLPEKYKQFKFVGKHAKYFNETTSMWKERVVEAFNEWVKNNAPKHLQVVAKTKKDIDKFNETIKRENKKYKAQSMSYDIVDVITGFTQELSQLKAIMNYNLDHKLADSLMTHDDGTGSFATHYKNAYSQFGNQKDRIMNISKVNNSVDVFASGLLRYTSMTYMYLNYTAGITNILKGITDMISHSSAAGLVGSKDIVKNGIAAVIKAVPKYLHDIKSVETDNLDVAIIKDFDDIYQDTREVQSSMTGSSMWVKLLNSADTIGYAPNSMGEFTMQFGMLLACTHSHRVVGGHIMAFQDFYQQQLEKSLLEVLDEDGKSDYARFKVDLDKVIAREEKRTKSEYHWSHNYASEFIKNNLDKFDKEIRSKLVTLIKDSRTKQEEAFAKFPTLHDSLEIKDGKLSYKEGSGLNENNMSMFRSRVKSINQSLHGIYNRVDRNSLQDSAIGDLFMQFKKWVIPNWNRLFGRRFGHIFYNEQLNAYEVPTFNVMFDMFRSGNKTFKDTLGNKEVKTYLKAVGNWFKGVYNFITNIKFYYQTLPANEQAAVIHLAKYAGALATSIIILSILRALDDDDEDDGVKNGILKHALYTATTYYQELRQPIPIIGWWSFIEQQTDSLFAGEKTLFLTGELVGLTAQGLLNSGKSMIYDRGAYKGEDKRLVKLRQLTPGYRQWNKLTHLGQTMSYYNRYGDNSGISNYVTKSIQKALGQDIEDEDED